MYCHVVIKLSSPDERQIPGQKTHPYMIHHSLSERHVRRCDHADECESEASAEAGHQISMIRCSCLFCSSQSWSVIEEYKHHENVGHRSHDSKRFLTWQMLMRTSWHRHPFDPSRLSQFQWFSYGKERSIQASPWTITRTSFLNCRIFDSSELTRHIRRRKSKSRWIASSEWAEVRLKASSERPKMTRDKIHNVQIAIQKISNSENSYSENSFSWQIKEKYHTNEWGGKRTPQLIQFSPQLQRAQRQDPWRASSHGRLQETVLAHERLGQAITWHRKRRKVQDSSTPPKQNHVRIHTQAWRANEILVIQEENHHSRGSPEEV